ncbi:Ig-like domain-containing protein [Roseivirga sp. BDSF3-8]|uniref:Ig-like domain-containing protein n=1 Tax=Roseivirga sp. BDSF3-8 TaxID=3241598 RepID=UPI0035321FE7
MNIFRIYFYIILSSITLLSGCDNDDDNLLPTNLINTTIDGTAVTDGPNSVSVNPQITLTFDAVLRPEAFENALQITGGATQPTYTVTYANANSQAVISPELQPNTTYTLTVNAATIGENGQALSQPYTLQLTTTGATLSACTSASNDCLRQMQFTDGSNTYTLDYFSTFDLTAEADFDQVTSAIILVHGAARNNDEYFTWMNSTLAGLNLSSNTLLIAPQFKDQSETSAASELYWNSNNWRDGDPSGNDFKISSFAVVDSLISQLTERATNLEHLIITGHSSGGLFTHVYAAANQSEDQLPATVSVDYIVANSQYFYYPTDERIDEATDQLYTPAGCTGYNFWPLGYNVVPPYVSTIPKATLDDQFINRSVTYLLGNGNQSDPTLNTTDCSATLLGSTRYLRGENIYEYLQQKYPGNGHTRVIINGIGHNGQAMYQSEEFEVLLGEVIGE